MNHAALPSWIGEYEGGMSERVKDIADTFTAVKVSAISFTLSLIPPSYSPIQEGRAAWFII